MNYTANDIVSLAPGRAFREKIGMYLSADRQEAINLGLRELIVNTQDEYEVYKPKNPLLKIILDTSSKTIQVIDNMRGIPVGKREDGINSLTAAFLLPHSGGKHLEQAYSSAIGCNGEGIKVVCHTAKWLEVTVKRNGKIWFQRFESDKEGAKAVTEVKNIGKSNTETGTKIVYIPDPEVYGDVFIDVEKLRAMLKEISYFTIGLKIELEVDGKIESFISQKGLVDSLSSMNALTKPFSYFYDNDECKVELALQWVTKNGKIRGYANGLYMPDGGAFISQFKSTLTKTFNSITKTKYSGEQIREVLDGVVSVKVKTGQFSNQAKTALANKEAATATSAAISSALKEYAVKQSGELETVLTLLNKLEKADAAAEKAREAILNHEKEQKLNEKKPLLNFNKLRDARKLGNNSLLLCVEGNSAGGSMSIGRDPEHEGVLMFRGKAINLIKAPIEDGLQNEEVKLLLQALGVTYGKPYDTSKLRYGKVALAVDGDFDGSHIALLLMGMLQTLCPEFIKENRLYWLRAPICKVETKAKTYYCYSQKELVAAPKGDITFYKGLGQMTDKDLKESMFSKEWRHLEPITWSASGIEQLCSLMGEEVKPRKDFVMTNINFESFEVE